jgi:hypothetical protein
MAKEKKDSSILDTIKEAKNQKEFDLLIKKNVGECSNEVLILFYSIIKKQEIQ